MTIASTSLEAVTAATASLVISASAAPTRTTRGRYSPPSPLRNARPTTRSSKLSVAALLGAHTNILGFATP